MTFLLTALALSCFAANSILCRLALSGGHIDPASFTFVRLVSGAAALWLLSLSRAPGEPTRRQSFRSALALCVYAVAFSFAYLRVFAGLGALVLFGAVQTTMLTVGLLGGERARPAVWLGLSCALAGLSVLALPGAHGADPLGLAAMALAGVAWGAYSLLGRNTGADPVRGTAQSFRWSVPVALPFLLPMALTMPTHASWTGLALAIASGVVASGVGYSIWYAALRRLTVTRAAILQLLVPVLAALAGLFLLHEPMHPRVITGGAIILFGVAIAVLGTSR